MAEYKPISIFDAEQKVIRRAMNEQVEDRAYEMAQELVDKYIKEVEDEYAVTDANGVECDGECADGSMWYDEVREDAKRVIFEKLAIFFQKQV